MMFKNNGNEKQKTDLKNLPHWDLTHLYTSIQDPEISKDLDLTTQTTQKFNHSYKGKLSNLTGDEFAKAIETYEALDEILSKLMSYAYLNYATQVSHPDATSFLQTIQEKITDISADLIFFTLELNKLPESYFNAAYQDSELLVFYKPWIEKSRIYIPHQLSDELEAFIHDKSVVGRSAWNRLFDETLADMRFPYQDKQLTDAEIFHLMSHKDEAVRKEAADVIGTTLKNHIKIFTLITNVLAKDKEITDKWRKFKAPISSRNLANHVEDEVVEALISTVKANYKDLSHRYYAWKAALFGKDKLEYWNRNAPLPDDDDTLIPWDEAKAIVLNAYTSFSPEIGAIVQRFFDEDWIDAAVTKGKQSGAFSHPVVPSVHPYVMMNYQGKTRDVMTLAHELGHGVHQVLAGEQQKHLISETPLTLAETASVFGEMLTFQSLLKSTTDPKRRKIMIANKVEDMLNTVIRQIAFVSFETEVHKRRQTKELSSDELGDIWMNIQKESLGPALHFEDIYKTYWSYIPHFIHSPFYVYAYAFGDCLVNSLYAVYQEGKVSDFQTKYQTLLASGGRFGHKELLKPFNLDASQSDFWQKGLKMIRSMIDQLLEMK